MSDEDKIVLDKKRLGEIEAKIEELEQHLERVEHAASTSNNDPQPTESASFLDKPTADKTE